MLKLVLPKGSLEEQTMRLFQEADLPVKRSSDREYNAYIDDPRLGPVKVLRPQEISRYVEYGHFDLGITGLDWILENDSTVVEVMDLCYSKLEENNKVKIVLGVPRDSGVTCAREIKPHSRISTEYPNLTKRFFAKLGIPVEIYLSYGATEAKVPDIADAIVDITETGSTLRRNGIEIIEVLLESSTKLIANPDSYLDPVKRGAIDEITTLLDGVLKARGKVLLKLNVAEELLEEVCALLPSMKAPTICRLYGTKYCAVETVVVKSQVNLLIPKLKAAGAEDILELPISKVVA